MKRALYLLLAATLLAGCDRPSPTIGVECTLNSDCGDPLVCRIERCRRQCVSSRDCGADLLCLMPSELGGVCQLPDERECALTSDCREPFVCRFGTCTTACEEDRDCASGARCEYDEEAEGNACTEPSRTACVYDSDCPAPYVCNDDQRCVYECVPEPDPYRDCVAPRVCVANRCVLPDGG